MFCVMKQRIMYRIQLPDLLWQALVTGMVQEIPILLLLIRVCVSVVQHAIWYRDSAI